MFFLFDADPDPTFQPDADPDQDPSFQIKAQTPGSYSIHFGLSSAKQIDAHPVLDPAYHFDAVPDADPDPDLYLMRIQVTKMMCIRIRIHNTGLNIWKREVWKVC